MTLHSGSRLAPPEVSWVETDLSDVISVQQPAEEPLQSQTVPKRLQSDEPFYRGSLDSPSMGTGAEPPLVSVPVVRSRIQTFLLVGLQQLVQVVHPHTSYI